MLESVWGGVSNKNSLPPKVSAGHEKDFGTAKFEFFYVIDLIQNDRDFISHIKTNCL